MDCRCCISDPAAVLAVAGWSLFEGVVEGSCEGAGGCWNSGSVFEVAAVGAVVDGVSNVVEAGVVVAVANAVDVIKAVAVVDAVVVVAATAVVTLELGFPTIVDSDNVLVGLGRLAGFFISGSDGRFGDENEKAFRLLLRFPGKELEFSGLFLLAAGTGLEVFDVAEKKKIFYLHQISEHWTSLVLKR